MPWKSLPNSAVFEIQQTALNQSELASVYALNFMLFFISTKDSELKATTTKKGTVMNVYGKMTIGNRKRKKIRHRINEFFSVSMIFLFTLIDHRTEVWQNIEVYHRKPKKETKSNDRWNVTLPISHTDNVSVRNKQETKLDTFSDWIFKQYYSQNISMQMRIETFSFRWQIVETVQVETEVMYFFPGVDSRKIK